MGRIKLFDNYSKLIILSLILSVITGIVNFFLLNTWFTKKPLWIEQAGALYYDGLIGHTSFQEGILQGLLISVQNGYDLGFLFSLFPQLHNWNSGHLLFNTTLLAVLLFVTGYLIWLIGKDIRFSYAFMVILCTIPGFYSLRDGIGAPFADITGSLCISISIIFLMIFFVKDSVIFLRLFCFFAFLATLARINAFFYLCLIASIPVVIKIIQVYVNTREYREIKKIIFNLVIFLVPCICLILIHVQSILNYANVDVPMWGLHNPPAISILNIITLINLFFGPVLYLMIISIVFFLTVKCFPWRVTKIQVLAGIIGSGIVLSLLKIVGNPYSFIANSSKVIFLLIILYTLFLVFIILFENKENTFLKAFLNAKNNSEMLIVITLVWWIIGFTLFLIGIGFASDQTKEIMLFSTPFCMITIFAIFFILHRVNHSSLYLGITVIFFILALGISLLSLSNSLAINSEQENDLIRSQSELAAVLNSMPNLSTWNSYSNYDYFYPVSWILYNRYGLFVYQTWPFFNHEGGWNDPRGICGGLNSDQCINRMYEETTSKIDGILIFADPDLKPPGRMDEHNFLIASDISRKIQNSSNWKLYTTVYCPYGGNLSIYQNLNRLNMSIIGY